MTIKNKAQLITYADSMGGNLAALEGLLAGPLAGLFGGVHILPPFPSSADRGFAPTTYLEIDPRLGTWDDVARIGRGMDVMLDLMVNHVSRQSEYFQDFVREGRASRYADLFITLDKVWAGGVPRPEDVAQIFLRKPERPFSDITIARTGETERVWTSFGSRDWSEQIDIDVHAPLARQLLADVLAHMARHEVKLVRLDAVGYVIKKPGTSCFFVEPEIWDFIGWIAGVAGELGIELLPEVHGDFSLQHKLAAHGYWVYDFVLPLLILHTLHTGNGGKLAAYLRACPRRQITMLDCHDGIPVLPDVGGVLNVDEARALVEVCEARGANLSRILSEQYKTRDNFDAHQINCTYYSALGADDDLYLTARALQFFAPGLPQVYYVGLLAGENAPEEVQRTGERRAINRRNYSAAEVGEALNKPAAQRLADLIRFRNRYSAFEGDLAVQEDGQGLAITRRCGEARCTLHASLQGGPPVIEYVDEAGSTQRYTV